MKIEIRKVENPTGDVFYHIYINDRHQEAIAAGNLYNEGFEELDKKGLEKAKRLYDNMVLYATESPKVTIIESTEI